VLQVAYSEQDPPAPTVGIGGKMQITLPARGVIIAKATPQIVTPVTPTTTVTVTTPIDGQTFTDDVAVHGTISPATNKLWMVLDGYIQQATVLTVASDGSWTATLPISDFAPGTQHHAVAFYSPDSQFATPQMRFTSNVACTPQVVTADDPAGDDKGKSGNYKYPQDTTFAHQMDITRVTL